MRKILITLCAFVMLVGFTVSTAMAQATWAWSDPGKINTGVIYSDFQFNPADSRLEGWNEDTDSWEEVLTDLGVDGVSDPDPDTAISTIVDSVAVPPFAVIDANTVAVLNGPAYVAINPQPLIPNMVGGFKYIAASYDGTTASLYVIYETTGTVEQHVITGTATMEWDTTNVRFTPRSLNLGSNGNWVTCKVSDLPALPPDYAWEEILDGFCIVAINDNLVVVVNDQNDTAAPLCRDSSGPSNAKNGSKIMAKFDRRALADEISAWIADNPDADPTSTKITLAYSDGTLNFYDDDTIKTKPAKNKKPKKK